jgi:hypothetical protein
MCSEEHRDGGNPTEVFGRTLIMDLQKTIAELREEFERVRDALAALERLAEGKRRGRPPKWLAKSRAAAVQDSKPAEKKRASAGTGADTPPVSKSAGA